MIGQTITFQNLDYRIIKLLGKGKSAYSWLCENDHHQIVLKQMHDEPCPYYAFSDKLESEITAYHQLRNLNIAVPEMVGFDKDEKWIFKEFVQGESAAQQIAHGKITDEIFGQLFRLAKKAKYACFNPDYFPTNFIISLGKLVYIDYELNPYDEKWNLQNWGIFYWVNQKGMQKFLETDDGKYINQDPGKGIPIKTGLIEKVASLIQKFES